MFVRIGERGANFPPHQMHLEVQGRFSQAYLAKTLIHRRKSCQKTSAFRTLQTTCELCGCVPKAKYAWIMCGNVRATCQQGVRNLLRCQLSFTHRISSNEKGPDQPVQPLSVSANQRVSPSRGSGVVNLQIRLRLGYRSVSFMLRHRRIDDLHQEELTMRDHFFEPVLTSFRTFG